MEFVAAGGDARFLGADRAHAAGRALGAFADADGEVAPRRAARTGRARCWEPFSGGRPRRCRGFVESFICDEARRAGSMLSQIANDVEGKRRARDLLLRRAVVVRRGGPGGVGPLQCGAAARQALARRRRRRRSSSCCRRRGRRAPLSPDSRSESAVRSMGSAGAGTATAAGVRIGRPPIPPSSSAVEECLVRERVAPGPHEAILAASSPGRVSATPDARLRQGQQVAEVAGERSHSVWRARPFGAIADARPF